RQTTGSPGRHCGAITTGAGAVTRVRRCDALRAAPPGKRALPDTLISPVLLSCFVIRPRRHRVIDRTGAARAARSVIRGDTTGPADPAANWRTRQPVLRPRVQATAFR